MFQGTVRALAALVAALFATTPLPPHNPLELFKVHNAALDLHPSITLNVNTTHIDDAAAWVSVAWRGVDLPSFDDFLALYPDGADVSATSPIKFKLAASDADHFSSGSGTALFRVLNMRHPVRFAFIRGGLQHPRVSAWSQALHPLRPNLPMAGRLTLTGRPGEVAVQWTTRDRGTAPQVQWGTQPGDYTFSADATITTYTREEMCGAPANGTGWFDPGKFHYAVMTGLDPGKRYYYRFGDPGEAVSGGAGGEEGDWSQEESFMGPKVGTGAGTSVRILAVADMGQAEVDGSLEVTQMQASLKTTPRLEAELQAHDYDLLIHNGDISYARGYATQWDVYWDQLSKVVTRVPYMTTIGNHERDWPGTGSAGEWDSGGECGIAYERQIKMPTQSEDTPWYSFDLGPVHFLQYSTEHPFHPGSPQHDFISSDLAGVNRTATPWVVVGGHRPIYIDSIDFPLWPAPDHDQTMARALRAAFEDLFIRYGVDATWHGHHHSYQRTCPVAGGKCLGTNEDGSARAPVHLVIGHAGAGLSPNIHFICPAIYQKVLLRHGYLRVEANATHMVHQTISSEDGTVMDHLTLVKPRSTAQRSMVSLLSGWGEAEAAGGEIADKLHSHRKMVVV